jgi:hypothetical protein
MPDPKRTEHVTGTSSTPAPPSRPASEAPREQPRATRNLAPASESADAAVHQLLAERQTASMNGDEAGMRAVDEALAKLGYR